MSWQREMDRLELGNRVALELHDPDQTWGELNTLVMREVRRAPMRVERYTCGCEPGSFTFCHLHSPEPADLDVFLRGGIR